MPLATPQGPVQGSPHARPEAGRLSESGILLTKKGEAQLDECTRDRQEYEIAGTNFIV